MCVQPFRLLKKNLPELLGNDVVDRFQASLESNWKRKGYLDKLFSFEEQQLILNAPDQELLLWILWSMKESVYKIINRSTGIREYAPMRFNCTSLLVTNFAAIGEVLYQGSAFKTRSDIQPGLIHTLAVPAEHNFTAIRVHQQHHTENYLSDFNQAQLLFSLRKNAKGLPELMQLSSQQNHPVSISHHGRFLAIAYSGFPLSVS
jgi:phosphopantetheinyl transferase (holo-ACP synthase)